MHSREVLVSFASEGIPKDEKGEINERFHFRLVRGKVRCVLAYLLDKAWVFVVVEEESSALGAGEKRLRAADRIFRQREVVGPDPCTAYERVGGQTQRSMHLERCLEDLGTPPCDKKNELLVIEMEGTERKPALIVATDDFPR